MQHLHRYAAFLQTIENGFSICTEFSSRFGAFPEKGSINFEFFSTVESIFNDLFADTTDGCSATRRFIISDSVALRAIDLLSGLLQQMKLLMDDTNAPSWNLHMSRSVVVASPGCHQNGSQLKSARKKQKKNAGLVFGIVMLFALNVCLVAYVSSKKLRRIAVTILLFPSVCFTITQLHKNSFIHNVSGVDLRCVLEQLIECDLLLCVKRGLKTTRRSTRVYVKRLPGGELDSLSEMEYRLLFIEKLEEFTEDHPELSIDEYIKQSSVVMLDASGIATDELLAVLSLPEFSGIDKSGLRSSIIAGRTISG